MKIKKFMYALLAGAMLASCSDEPNNGPSNNADPQGSGYVSIAIGMPKGVSSRGANDQFSDGLAEEYKVNSLAILFFTGREETANFYRAYNVTPVGNTNVSQPADDQTTSIKKVTFPVDITATNESLWALAVVNHGEVMTVDDKGKVMIGGTEFTTEKTIADFMKLTTNANLTANTSGGNFFMTNTPYTTAPGMGNTVPTGFVHLLASVDKEKIMETEALAKDNPAAEIFVERAVAKIEVIADKDDIKTSYLPEIAEIEWTIDNTEPTSFIARNLVGSDATEAPEWLGYNTAITDPENSYPTSLYRFAGNTPFSAGKEMYRIYFGIDPRGNGISEGNTDLKVLKDDEITNTTFKTVGEGKPQYCYENTFDVAHQDYRNTTRALLKVTFKGGDFYTRGLDRTTKYTFDNAAATLAHFALENTDVVAAYTAHFNEAKTITITDLVFETTTNSKTAKNNWINLSFEVKDGLLLVNKIILLDGEDQTDANKVPFLENVDEAKVIEDINKQVTFNAYVGGVSYYAVRIKHFGDDLTPWHEPTNEAGDVIATPDTKASYGEGNQAEQNYLGRYGVLRNNWYQLNISEISKFGEAIISNLPLDGTPDDNVDPEKAIYSKVNILSWAKRSQDVEL